MKRFLTIILLFMTTMAFGQFPDNNPGSDSIEKEADRITKEYNEQLVLTGVQIPLFKDKVEDYLVKAEDIKRKLKGRAELDALLELQTKETLEMNDILTQIQQRLYKKLKLKIQPLKVIESKE